MLFCAKYALLDVIRKLQNLAVWNAKSYSLPIPIFIRIQIGFFKSSYDICTARSERITLHFVSPYQKGAIPFFGY
jgi:hypothetical protein